MSCKHNDQQRCSSRSLALEKAYVHDVYSAIAKEQRACSPVRSHVKEFLFNQFEVGSILLDIGCGDGKYLNLKPDIVTVGLERCYEWFCNDLIKNRYCKLGDIVELVSGDVMALPFRNDFFDGVLCCGVLHHICTADRRIDALKEMTRIMKVGGRLLLTVTSRPVLGKEIESQDVLIRWETENPKSVESDTTSNTSSSSSSSSNYVRTNTMYESCNSPSSEVGSCYSFVKKTLQRFSLTGTVSTKPFSTMHKSRTSGSSSISTSEELPIELRNIDEITTKSTDKNENKSNESPIDQNERRKNNINQNLNGSSLFSIIRNHFISFHLQLKTKQNLLSTRKNGFLKQKLVNQRFSLPTDIQENYKQSKVYESVNKKQSKLELNQIIYENEFESSDAKVDKTDKEKSNSNKIQRSFSSESFDSRQANSRMTAYYSMPELFYLNEPVENELNNFNSFVKNKPKIRELHPITFLKKNCASKDIKEKKFEENETIETSKSEVETENKELELHETCDTIQTQENVCQAQGKNFPKKLLRQRSFSADYQPEVPKPPSEHRRFSANPVGYQSNRQNHIFCHQQMSIDSDESLITIIPAVRSTRESVTEPFTNLNEENFDVEKNLDLFEEDVVNEDIIQEDVVNEEEDEDDDARCDEINEECSDDTSASTVNTKSVDESDVVISSTPSPPKILHRYFHIFRKGELEQLIEQNINDLHVVQSYYNEHATSWCVVCEKVQVWTI